MLKIRGLAWKLAIPAVCLAAFVFKVSFELATGDTIFVKSLGSGTVGVPLALDDFEAMRTRVPVLCDLKPSGRFVATELHQAGGIPQVMKILLEHGVLHGDALTMTGQMLAEVLRDIPAEPRKDQEVIHP